MKISKYKRQKTINKWKVSERIMVIIGVLMCLIGVVLVYWNIPFSPMHSQFSKEMGKRAEQTNDMGNELCTREEIDKLPQCLREYCDYIGLEGTKKRYAYHTYFYDVDFLFDESKGVKIKMDYDLWTFTDKAYRQAFCKAKMYGIPFEGVDYLETDALEGNDLEENALEENELKTNDNSNGLKNSKSSYGGMKGYLAKAFQIFDTPVENIREAALITIMGEGAALNPSILLLQDITYEELDSERAKATYTYKGVKGSGIFIFDKDENVLAFESDERQPDEERDGKLVSVGWRCEGSDFQRKDGMLLPQETKAIKIYPDKDVVYFDAKKYDVTYY